MAIFREFFVEALPDRVEKRFDSRFEANQKTNLLGFLVFKKTILKKF